MRIFEVSNLKSSAIQMKLPMHRSHTISTHRGSRRHIIAVLVTLLSSFVIGHSSFSAPLDIRLVSEVTSIQPGQPFYVGLSLTHAEHYHTYWKFPGIVGVPTDMAWKLPPGWKADAIEWPAPERVMMFQIKAQGFHGTKLLPMKLTPPADLSPGTQVNLEGKATWMCCGSDCNPGFADLSITLPVSATSPVKDGKWQEMFRAARADVARPLEGWKAAAKRDGEKVVLKLTPETPASFPTPEGIFFTEDGFINADKDQVFRKEGQSLIVELTVSSYYTEKVPDALKGVLWLKDGSLGKGAIINVPFSKP